MEYCHGGRLRDYIDSLGPMPAQGENTRSLVKQILQVHSDIRWVLD